MEKIVIRKTWILLALACLFCCPSNSFGQAGYFVSIWNYENQFSNLGIDTQLLKRNAEAAIQDWIDVLPDSRGRIDVLVQPEYGIETAEVSSATSSFVREQDGHLGNDLFCDMDLTFDLMNGISLNRGVRYDTSALDLAMLRDMGINTRG